MGGSLFQYDQEMSRPRTAGTLRRRTVACSRPSQALLREMLPPSTRLGPPYPCQRTSVPFCTSPVQLPPQWTRPKRRRAQLPPVLPSQFFDNTALQGIEGDGRRQYVLMVDLSRVEADVLHPLREAVGPQRYFVGTCRAGQGEDGEGEGKERRRCRRMHG